MKRIWGHVVSFCAAAMVVGANLPACVTNDQSIFIRGALAPAINRQNGACAYTNDPAQPMLFQARLDVAVTDSYFAILLVGNQLVGRGDPAANRAESSRVHVKGGVVRVTEPNGAPIREFTSAAVGFADPQTNNAPGWTTIGLVAIDAPTKAILEAQLPNRTVSKSVLVNVKVFGETLAGSDVESGELQLPMQVCKGCLIDYSTGDDPLVDPTGVHPNCVKPLPESAGTVRPCFAGQDEQTPCQLCKGLRPACDALYP